MPIAEVQINDDILKNLGEAGVRDVCACLWAVDCQTCGRFLGDEPPALVVDDIQVAVAASIHHQACRVPQWNDSGLIVRIPEDHLSWVSIMVMAPIGRSGKEEMWPMLLINPGLEQVPLERDEQGGYRVLRSGSRSLGDLQVVGPGVDIGAPLNDAVATLATDSISVSFLTAPSRTYSAPADRQFLDAARQAGGVLVGVSHALHPDELSVAAMNQAILNGWLAGGRVPLHGAPAPPPRPEHHNRATATYALDWSAEYMSVGRVLGHHPGDLTVPEAMRWASDLTGAGDALIGWTPVDDDHPEEGWFTLNALSVQQYFLRRHPDGWRLIGAFARVAGRTGVETDNEAKAWAIEVLKRKRQPTNLTWEPGPSTPCARTLYAQG